MTKQVGLFRIMCRDEVPTIKTVTARGQETSVLNLNLVQYSTKEGNASPWFKLTLWGWQAEKYAGLIQHNHACYVDGDVQFESYVTKAFKENGEQWDVNRISPKFEKLTEFRLVNVVTPPRDEEESAPSSIAQRASAAANSGTGYDDIPF